MPRAFVLENVAGLSSIHGGVCFRWLIDELRDCGYCVDFAVLDSSNFGLPQRRRRLYMVGRKGVWKRPFNFPTDSCSRGADSGRVRQDKLAAAGTDDARRVALDKFLDPPEADDDPWRLPPSGGARANVVAELKRCAAEGVNFSGGDLVIDIDCS